MSVDKTVCHPKELHVEKVFKKVEASYSFLILRYSCLGIKSLSWLRREVRASGDNLLITTNNILRRVLLKLPEGEREVEKIYGQNLILFLPMEMIKSLKLISSLAKKHELLQICSVYISGQFLDDKKISELHSWSEKEEGIAKILRSLLSPIVSLIFLLKALSERAKN